MDNLIATYTAISSRPKTSLLIVRVVAAILVIIASAQLNTANATAEYSQEYISTIASIDSLWTLDKYNEAIPLIHRTLPTVIKNFGKESQEYFHFLSMTSQIYSDSGNDKQALALIEDVINGCRRSYGCCNPLYAKALSNKALFLINLGQSAKAIPIFGESINVFKKFGESLDYATCLKDLAIAYYDTGQYEKALATVSRANDVLNTSESTIADAAYVSILLAAIDLESELGDSHASIERAIKLLNELRLNNIHIQLQSDIMLGLVCSYLSIDDYTKAIEEGLELIKFNQDNSLDETRKDLGTIQYYIGLAYYLSSDYNNAKNHLMYSLKTREQTYGVLHPYTIGALSWLVDTLVALEDDNDLIKYLEQLCDRTKKDFLSQFPLLDSNGQENYWNELYSDFYINKLPNLCNRFDNETIFQLAYDGSLLAKGILLESDVRFRHELRNHEDPSYHNRFMQIEDARKSNSIDKDSIDFEEQKLRLEFISNSNYLEGFNTSWKDVRASLKDNEIAIEFLASSISKSDDQRYSALIVSSAWDNPKYVNLFTKKELQVIEPEDYYTTDKLSMLLWEPIRKIIGDVDVIYFSPIGELYNISIENLPLAKTSNELDTTRRYMSDLYSLNRLNSTRDLKTRALRNFVVSASLFGDMDYDGIMTTTKKSTKTMERGNDYRSGFGPLPGTRIELDNINKTLLLTGIDISTYSKNQGTKHSFLKMSGESPSIIHVATHGFYNIPTEENISALDCSGLAFSSFNCFLGKEPRYNEGCLTASEISKMDLYNTDLVVLSACQTGLGKIQADGVFGLQRGFKMAGVNTIMMSLWEVDDEATQLLMTEFYRNYVNGMSKMDSLHNAQKKVQETPGFSDPEYWAAFILLDALN